MTKIYLVIILFLSANFVSAQDDTLELLKGEWYFFGSTQPGVNDAFRLRRDKIHESYVKWEFRENGSFYEQDIAELPKVGSRGVSEVIMGSNVVSTWIFNKEKQTIELKDLQRIYKITGIENNFLELIRLK